ncbi:MAG TPA: hypothetical protein DCO72_07500 [Ruminococcus sp.]|nr:hypothetical protein [Ruminococcus sp.]
MRKSYRLIFPFLLFALCACGKKAEPQVDIKTLNVSSVISSARELTTLKYEYTDFGTYEREAEKIDIPLIGKADIPMTKEEFIFTYGGTICVGFQLEDVVPQVDEENKVITIEVPEPIVLSHTPNHDADGVYVIKNSIKTNTSEKITGYEDTKDKLRKAKEEALMAQEDTRKDAIKEYKKMCEAWLLSADSNVSEYQIKYIESEKT